MDGLEEEEEKGEEVMVVGEEVVVEEEVVEAISTRQVLSHYVKFIFHERLESRYLESMNFALCR